VKRLLVPALLLLLSTLADAQHVYKRISTFHGGFSIEIDRELSRSVEHDHVVGFLKYLGDKAVFLDDDVVTTKEAIERYLVEYYGQTKFTLTLKPKAAQPLSRTMGYTTGRYFLSGRYDRCGCTLSEEGNYLLVWQLVDGRWRIKSWIPSADSTQGCGCAKSSDFGPSSQSK